MASEPEPLAQGFATFGGDSGHHKNYFPLPDALNTVDASFARNAEERLNFAYDGLKKDTMRPCSLWSAGVGVRPSRMFFLGGSGGGREAYSVVQRWPENYDGVLGAYAGWDPIELDLQYIRGIAGHLHTRWLSNEVEDQTACAISDESVRWTGRPEGWSHRKRCRLSLRFRDAALPGRQERNCFTPQELITVQTFATEQRTAQPLWNGVQTMPGFNVLAGADLTGSMGLLHHPGHPPKFFLNSYYYVISDRVLRNFLTGDEHFNTLAFNTATGGEYAGDLLPKSQMFAASDPDLTRFAQHGGKFLMLHGTTDLTIPTDASVMYYKMLQSRMSPEEVDRFVRFYLIPGFGHGRGVFKAGFDALGVLDRWLDTGVAPKDLVVVDNNKGSGGRTRPVRLSRLAEIQGFRRCECGE